MSLSGLFPIDKWNFKTQSVLASLPEEEYHALCAHMIEQRYNKGETIFRQGTIASGIFYIKEGRVKKYQADKSGREQIIYVANAGELIGYHALLAEERYPDSAATLETAVITFIPKEDFLYTVKHSAVLSRRLLKTLSHEFTVLTNSISLFAQRSVKQRLAVSLVVLREKFKAGTTPGHDILINISRSDLANIVGTGSENITRFLTEFKSAGIISTRGRNICVTDLKQLIALSGCGNV